MNEQIMRTMGLGKYVDKVKRGVCPFCAGEIGPFRDELSRREHEISGLCQKCQDEIWPE